MTKIGRNDPCPCGSGKKYKKCCLSKHEEEKTAQRIERSDPINKPTSGLVEIEDADMDDDTNEAIEEIDDSGLSESHDEGGLEEKEKSHWTPSYHSPLDGLLPKISKADDKLIDEWYNIYDDLEDPDLLTQHLLDFIKTRPDLILNLEIHKEVLFEIGARYIRQGQHDRYVELLKYIRHHHLEAYLKSFGYYERDLITDAVIKKDSQGIEEHLKYFKQYPEEDPDNLFKVIDFLCAQNCQEIIIEFVKSIYKIVCNSTNIINGDDILNQLVWSYVIHFLKPDFTDADMERLSNDLKTIDYDLNETFIQPENLKEIFSKIFSPPPFPDRKNLKTRKARFDYYLWASRNFSYYLTTSKNMGWMAAEFYRARIGSYFCEAVPKDKMPKVIMIFTKNKIEAAVVRTSKDLISLNSTMAFGMLNAVFWFADYLKELGFIDSQYCDNIQQWCRELFDEAYDLLRKDSFTAKAFQTFPLIF